MHSAAAAVSSRVQNDITVRQQRAASALVQQLHGAGPAVLLKNIEALFRRP